MLLIQKLSPVKKLHYTAVCNLSRGSSVSIAIGVNWQLNILCTF